ncbi:MAG: ribonuclease P protein component [Oscillospiraceae bacterium]|nr:ribonuclease P protein component [Oscillospiraceae bacterium]
MRFSHSLKENYLFRRLYRRGDSLANGFLVLYCRKNGLKENRLGITVSGKMGKAVYRNKIRRRLREIYRLHEEEFSCGFDMVVVARTRGMSADYAQLEKAFLSLGGKLGLLRGDLG